MTRSHRHARANCGSERAAAAGAALSGGGAGEDGRSPLTTPTPSDGDDDYDGLADDDGDDESMGGRSGTEGEEEEGGRGGGPLSALPSHPHHHHSREWRAGVPHPPAAARRWAPPPDAGPAEQAWAALVKEGERAGGEAGAAAEVDDAFAGLLIAGGVPARGVLAAARGLTDLVAAGGAEAAAPEAVRVVAGWLEKMNGGGRGQG